VSGVGTRTFEVPLNNRPKFLECAWLDVELPLKVGAYFVLHLVDLPKGKHTMIDDTNTYHHMTSEVIMKVEMKRRRPKDLRAVTNVVSSLYNR